MRMLAVFGTRPEWIKLSPLIPLFGKSLRLVHTGQHYSPALDSAIRRDLGLRAPDYRLRLEGTGFPEQLGGMLRGLDRILRRERPGLVVVQGDTNSSLAGALAAARLGIPVAHVEAGCRSGNLAAPEEQNRRMIDGIATLLYCADETALRNLRREGRADAVLTGSTGVDAVLQAAKRGSDGFLKAHGVEPDGFALATLHRAENTDSKSALRERLEAIAYASRLGTVVLAVHPRTAGALERHGVRLPPRLKVTRPLAYLEFLSLLRRCRFVLSDSGGIQEEAAVLGSPCLVLRGETEWSRLIEAGRNFLVPSLGSREKALIARLWEDDAFLARIRRRPAPGLRAGAAERIRKSVLAWAKRKK